MFELTELLRPCGSLNMQKVESQNKLGDKH